MKSLRSAAALLLVATMVLWGAGRVPAIENPAIEAIEKSAIEKPAAGKQDRQPLSVRQLLALKKRWANFSALGLSLKVEGRLGAFSPTLMRLKKCPLRFVPQPNEQFPRLPKGTKHVELTGQVQRRGQGQRYDFVVQSVQAAPTDDERLQTMQRGLPRDKAKPWYAVAEWAKQRGGFYEDDDLLKQADTLLLRAVKVERSHLEADDIAGRVALAEKVARLKLGKPLQQELVHEVWHLKWRAHRKTGKPLLTQLIAGIGRDLPGSTIPLKEIPEALQNAYSDKPLETYSDSDAETRRLLNRLLYVQMVWDDIKRQTKPDGSNGFAIAKQIEKRLPELSARAEQYRQRELNYRFDHITEADRNEAIALAKLYRERKSPEMASKTLKRWLTAQRLAIKDSRPTELIQLADDYLQWLDDKPQAVTLLKRAWEQLPNSGEIIRRMNRLGYVLHDGRWVDRANVKTGRDDPIAQAIREGRVLPGMTHSQVLKAMAASPVSTSRVASRRKINEVWLFRLPNNTRKAVHFSRSSSEPRSAARVVLVSRLP